MVIDITPFLLETQRDYKGLHVKVPEKSTLHFSEKSSMQTRIQQVILITILIVQSPCVKKNCSLSVLHLQRGVHLLDYVQQDLTEIIFSCTQHTPVSSFFLHCGCSQSLLVNLDKGSAQAFL